MRNDAKTISIMIKDESHPSDMPIMAMTVPACALMSGLEEVSKLYAGTEWAIAKVGPGDGGGPRGAFVPHERIGPPRPAPIGWTPVPNWR